MTAKDRKNSIEEAIELRRRGDPRAALELLKAVLKSAPDSSQANYQVAWTYDSMGQEQAAVPYYEAAIELGLGGADLCGAMLGLGSTYRCLGQYQKSLELFDRASKLFPENRALKTFRALTLYNLGQAKEAVGSLLIQLIETTNDKEIQSYKGALEFYSDKLDEQFH